ncbi:hypothetical protein TRFO_15882 [Tritrichomonas foetus]|uniref:Uncharacterized protein n=1 Tax=Tritrichomonas foetus TaxID=1144522 RepID=A0A1J4KVY6_9EUKA|nr:hypothetical protein TRFO_15882 [Tritrichomonas foetus]|eukprot:OHT13862.1 hypothetical protein TRFO_15882 [Tritrichomonas foetus]
MNKYSTTKDEIKEIKREKIVKNIEFEELNVNKDNEKLNHGISKRGRSGRRKTRNNSFNKEESEDDTFLSRENESSFSKKNRVKLPQNIVMPPKLKRMNKIPDFAIWDNTRMKTYVPQLGDNVVYIRDAHIQYSHECQCDFYPPPFNRKDNFPSIAFGTVTQIGFFVSSFVVRVHIEKPKIYEMRADILIPYPLAPPILIERSKFESSMTCTRNLLIGREIDFIVDDREIMSATLLSLNNDWERQPYNSITISLPNLITEPKASNDQENNDFCERISPWDIQFPLRRQGGRTSNSAISVCKQVGVFVKSLINKETNRGFFDWRLCDKEKQFANSMIRPVDFTMFLRRLSSEHYYRSPLEILEDVSRLRSTLNIISPKYHRHIDEVTTAISNSITRASEHYK